MKKIFLILIIICNCRHLFSQKLSREGDYVSNNNGGVLVIQSTNSSWKKEIKDAKSELFTIDGKKMIYKKNDSLCLLTLGTDQRQYIPDVIFYKIPLSGTGEWLAYQSKNIAKKLVLHNLVTNKDQNFAGIGDYIFDKKGTVLLLKRMEVKDNLTINSFEWINLAEGKSEPVYSGSSTIVNYSFDVENDQLAFILQEKKDANLANSIWYYKAGMNKASVLAHNSSAGIDEGLIVDEKPLSFSKDGSKVFFYLKEKELPKPNPDFTKVDVWSYTDALLQNLQSMRTSIRDYQSVISLPGKQIIQLEQEGEYLLGSTEPGEENMGLISDDYRLVYHFEGDVYRRNTGSYTLKEANWNKATATTVFLVSTKDGTRKVVKEKFMPMTPYSGYPYFRFSPGGRYVIYFDAKLQAYFSYEITSEITRNLTKKITVSWIAEYNDDGFGNAPRFFYTNSDIIDWLSLDTALFVYDHYKDIWQLDPLGLKSPLNITNGYARKNKMVFEGFTRMDIYGKKILFQGSYRNGWSQVFYKEVNQPGYPNQIKDGSNYISNSRALENDNIYLIGHGSDQYMDNALQSYTRDFKTLIPIVSSLTEQKSNKHEKFTTEPLTWKSHNGKELTGVLYKPEGFDSTKKYPIIFGYYEGVWLNVVRNNIAVDFDYCMKNGYIVFIPAITYIIGEAGLSAYNSVVSAAEYLSNKPYVDANKMGLVGHSFGGYETNYLVTHTNLFAAAFSSAGVSDLTSLAGSEVASNCCGNEQFVELSQTRVGASLWERPDLWLKNSPIFYANRVVTPIMLIANKNDSQVPWLQGIEFFKALRRLGKRVWLLQYDDEGHGYPKDATIREMQFFDHYLKSAPAPIWMTKGIPAKMRGLTLGLEYDTAMKTPGPGLLMDVEIKTPQQKELVKHKTTVNEQGRIMDVTPMKTRRKD